jgi:hypothetical protein
VGERLPHHLQNMTHTFSGEYQLQATEWLKRLLVNPACKAQGSEALALIIRLLLYDRKVTVAQHLE